MRLQLPLRKVIRGARSILMGAILVAAAGPVPAQTTDCAGFLEHPIGTAGTNGAAAIHAADLNGDGHVDILAASANDDTIAWYRNPCGDPGTDCEVTTPVFQRRVIATDADGVTSIHAVDIDADGDIDVLAASANNNTIALYENISSGGVLTFVRLVISTSARRAQSVFAARIDGDADIDILSASFTNNTIAWYENPRITNTELNDEPSFGFIRRIVSTAAVNASAVHAIDLDGDGDTDVLSASIADDKIAWYENTGVADDADGNPQQMFTEHVITRSADGARSVFAADLDGDGDVDVLSASISDDTVAWYENDGATPPAFTTHEISTTADGAKSVHAADLNGDGDVDIVVAAERAGTIYWYENDGNPSDPTFTERAVSTNVASADAVFVADVNSDGFPDVLSASSVPGTVSDNDKVAWHENDEKQTPNFSERVVASTAEGLNALFLADIDNDGEEDVVAATTTNQIVWYSIDAGPPVSFNRNLIADGVADPRSVFAIDLDADGDMDVLSASARNDRVLWHVNGLSPQKGGAPVFSETRVIASGLDVVESIFVADLDGDSYGDVVSASSGDDKVAWFRNPCATDCSGPFAPHILASIDSDDAPIRTANARSVFVVDVDGDGDNDILAASSGDDKVTLFVNQLDPQSKGGTPTAPEFLERIIASANLNDATFSEPGAFSVAATDIDNDGDVDLLVAASGAGSINWYEQDVDPGNPGLQTFTQRAINLIAPIAVFVGFADVDGDGDQDVLATTFGDDRVLWHENRLEDREDPDDTLIFTRHFVNFDGSNPRSVVLTDVDNDGTAGDDLDMIVGFRFRSSWFERVDELCVTFDVNGDELLDGIELAWIGRAFGESSATPAAEWWGPADFNRDGVIDGLDLAILSMPGVWGESTAIVDGVAECSYTCR